MKKHIFLYLLIYCLFRQTVVVSQDTALIDSLKFRLNEIIALKSKSGKSGSSINDTTQVKILCSLSKAYWSFDLQESGDYAKQALSIAQSIEYKKGIALSCSCLGVVYWYKCDYPSALEFHQKALKFYKVINDATGIGNSYSNIGLIYHNQGAYPLALKYYLLGLVKREQVGDTNGMAHSYNNIGNIYFDQHNYTLAMKYYEPCLRIRIKSGNKSSVANAYNNIANVYVSQQNYDQGLKMHQEALRIRQSIGDQMGIASSFVNIGTAYEYKEEYDVALNYFLKALKIDDEIDNPEGLAEDYSSMGDVYLKLGKLQKAELYIAKALKYAMEIGNLDLVYETHKNLSELYEQLGDHKRSLQNYKLYIQYRDSVTESRNSQEMVRLQMQYDYDKKEALVKAQQEKREKVMEATMASHRFEKYLYVSFGVFLLLTIFMLWSRLRLSHKTKKILEQKNEQIKEEKKFSEQQKVRAELLDIRHKIARDLHDEIGSSLSSIYMYSEVAKKITAGKVPEAGKILSNVGDIAHEAMENMNDIVWTINPTKDKLDDIMKRLMVLSEHLNESSDVTVHFDVPKNLSEIQLSMQQRKNLYLIFKEAFNNIAKYAKAVNCYVQLMKNENELLLSIKDDGIGFDKQREGFGGNGLINMRNRAQEINGYFEIVSERGRGTELKFAFKL